MLDNVQQAIFAYNHLESYVQAVLYWAGLYASGGYTVSTATLVSAEKCLPGVALTAHTDSAVATAIAYAEQQLGKPYLWGGTGPDAFDCSGLMMMAYRAAGVDIPRTSQQQWTWGPRVSPSQVRPGDLVFFAGSDGTKTSPGHVGLVIGGGLMIEAYATGFPHQDRPVRWPGPGRFHPAVGSRRRQRGRFSLDLSFSHFTFRMHVGSDIPVRTRRLLRPAIGCASAVAGLAQYDRRFVRAECAGQCR